MNFSISIRKSNQPTSRSRGSGTERPPLNSGLMKRLRLKMTLCITVTALAGFAIFLAVHINPYLYANVYGDAGTKRLYKLYSLSKNGVAVNQLREFAEANKIVVIEHEKDSMFSAHNDSDTNSEEVYVWYSGGAVTKARFNINNP